ncbi:MAG: hypothetical protein HY902_10450 [Deltaproteobacteria bacterium]|nr:hypothetical protein [Deltaproteobacteria bacterium]
MGNQAKSQSKYTRWAWLAAAALAVLSACTDDFEPPYRISKLRVLGVKAAPPEVHLDSATSLNMLVASPRPDVQLCYGWAFCPFAWAKDGNYKCLDPDLQVDLGTGATATVTFATLMQSLSKAPDVFKKMGMGMPSGSTAAPDLGCIPGGKVATGGATGGFSTGSIPDFYVLFQVGEVGEYGGTCPTNAAAMLAKICDDRNNCLAGFKRLGLAPMAGSCAAFDAAKEPTCAKTADSCAFVPECGCDGKTYSNACERAAAKVSKSYDGECRSVNQNPELQGVGLRLPAVDVAAEVSRGVAWPEDVTPVLAPGSTVQFWPRWDPSQIQVIGPSSDPAVQEPVKETLLFSWFSEAGDFSESKTWHGNPQVDYTAPGLSASETSKTVPIWLVVRDQRNGTGWLRRQVRIEKGASLKQNPVCAAAPTAAGCTTP